MANWNQQRPADKIITKLVYRMERRPHGRQARALALLLTLRGTDIGRGVKIGPDFLLRHGGSGVVIHGRTKIGSNVTVYQGVTVGRARPWDAEQPGSRHKVIIEDDVVLCAGAVVVTERLLVIAHGSVVGANSVLTCSTGPWEVWAGNPARRVGLRRARGPVDQDLPQTG